MLGLLLAVGAAASLERAALAVLLTHLVVLAIGIVLCRRLFSFERSAFDLPSVLVHARFGLTVFGANLLLRLPWRLGETALALGGVEAAQIAFFNVALSATAAFTQLLGSATTLQIPSLSLREAAGDLDGRDRGLGVSLRYLTVSACLFVLVIFAAAPLLVRTLLGEAYLGVLPNLSIVALSALAAPLIRTSLARAVVGIRLLRTAVLGVVAVASFAVAGAVLIPRQGAEGASIALVVANFAAAAVAIHQIRGTGVLHHARMLRQLLAAALPAALLLIAGHGPIQATAAAALYLLAVSALRLIDWRDLRRIATAAALG
jgi:O-antigen/teichoic acid export membrane protein